MSNNDDSFLKRVRRIADRLGLPIRELSLPYIAKLVRRDGDGSALADATLADRVAALVPHERQHFDLKAGKELRRGDLLEHANRVAEAVRPKAKPTRRKLTPEQEAWKEKFGLASLLDRWPSLNYGPEFEDESNEDE